MRRRMKRNTPNKRHHSRWRALRVKEQGSKCAICKCFLYEHNTTLDHKTPLHYGGYDRFSNTQALCERCNRIKGNALPLDADGSYYFGSR